MKVPKGSGVVKYAWEVCGTKDKEKLAWDEVGPKLLGEAVERHGLERYMLPASAFCAIPVDFCYMVFEPQHQFVFDKDTYAIHLWHDIWRRRNWDIDANHAPECLYEQLKARFLGNKTISSKRRYKII